MDIIEKSKRRVREKGRETPENKPQKPIKKQRKSHFIANKAEMEEFSDQNCNVGTARNRRALEL